MSKLILMSILVAMVAIPARAATTKNPRRGLKRALIQSAVFFAFHGFALKFLWGRW